MRELVIVGSGGTSVDILDAVLAGREAGSNDLMPVAFLDDDPSRIGTTLHGLPVHGPLERAGEMRECLFIIGIGSPRSFVQRPRIVERLALPADRFATVVHPTASVSRMAVLGPGSAILQNVTVSANAVVGSHVVILPNSVISHDCVVGDHTCIAGGVCLSGAVVVGRSCYVGTNASVIGGVRLHDMSLVGMGSVVLADVLEKTVVVGAPARILRRVDVA